MRPDDTEGTTLARDGAAALAGGAQASGRAIGRIAGKDGKTKFAIENASKTRIVLADSKIHILGGFKNVSGPYAGNGLAERALN